MSNNLSLIQKLKKMALDSQKPTSDLLRLALVVSKDMGATEFETRIKYELEGYPLDVMPPKYRQVMGALRCFNPIHGWIPLSFEDPKDTEKLSNVIIRQPISEFEKSLTNLNEKGIYRIFWSGNDELKIMELMHPKMRPCVEVNQGKIHSLLDSVRNYILTEAIKLDENKLVKQIKPTQSETDKRDNLKKFLMNPWVYGTGSGLIVFLVTYLFIHLPTVMNIFERPSNRETIPINQQLIIGSGTNINAKEVRIGLNSLPREVEKSNYDMAILMIIRTLEDGQKELEKIKQDFPGKISEVVSDVSRRGVFQSSLTTGNLNRTLNFNKEAVDDLLMHVKRQIEDALINNGFPSTALTKSKWLSEQSKTYKNFQDSCTLAKIEMTNQTQEWLNKTR